MVSWLVKALFIIGPQQWMTSTIFVQDEMIAQLFAMAAAWYLVRGDKPGALVMLALGVVFGKVFMVLPLFYLTLFYRPGWRDARAWLLMMSVYGVNVAWALINDGNVPFVGFSPEPNYGSHYWVPLVESFPDSMALLKNISLSLSVLAQTALCALFMLQSRILQRDLDPWVLIGLPLATFFFTF